MPTCVICGQEISKRKSLAYGEGRACREHDEVTKMQEMVQTERQVYNKKLRYVALGILILTYQKRVPQEFVERKALQYLYEVGSIVEPGHIDDLRKVLRELPSARKLTSEDIKNFEKERKTLIKFVSELAKIEELSIDEKEELTPAMKEAFSDLHTQMIVNALIVDCINNDLNVEECVVEFSKGFLEYGTPEQLAEIVARFRAKGIPETAEGKALIKQQVANMTEVMGIRIPA